MKRLPDVETLRKQLDYCPDTGVFTNKVRSLGYFKDKEEAIERRKLGELMYHSPLFCSEE